MTPIDNIKSEFMDAYFKYTELSQKRRGEFLNQIIFLERSMDEYIAKFFCSTKTKRDVMLSLILRTVKIGLSNKKDISTWIIKNRDKQFRKLHPKSVSELTEIVKYRNAFAHGIIEENRPITHLKNKETVFISYDNKKPDFHIDENNYSRVLANVDDYITSFLFNGKFSDIERATQPVKSLPKRKK